jgi:anti-sigma factor RsiW
MTNHEEAVERHWSTQYALGELRPPDRDQFEEHLFDCAACLESVKTAYLFVRGVEATLGRPVFGDATQTAMEPAAHPAMQSVAPPLPKPIKGPKRRLVMLALPYAAVVFLSFGMTVQYAALRNAHNPQAVVAYAVSPQAKGSDGTIRIPAGAGSVELGLDVLETAPQYQWEIRAAGADRALIGGQQKASSDSTLKLVLPAGWLRPGRFEARVGPLGRQTIYPFEVTENTEK